MDAVLVLKLTRLIPLGDNAQLNGDKKIKNVLHLTQSDLVL